MKLVLTLAALLAASPAMAGERPFWQWFGHPVTVQTDEDDIHLITPDGKAEASASHTGQGTNHASVSSGPNGSTASASASGSVSGSGSVSTSSTSTAHAGGMQ